ncbi:hypothetical protein, partial [Neisseria meningitidis]|uniref:hypothetical protein n=1 Tax=Neisseria meningitidis TaxID=487 RepID=UPI001C99DBFE
PHETVADVHEDNTLPVAGFLKISKIRIAIPHFWFAGAVSAFPDNWPVRPPQIQTPPSLPVRLPHGFWPTTAQSSFRKTQPVP